MTNFLKSIILGILFGCLIAGIVLVCINTENPRERAQRSFAEGMAGVAFDQDNHIREAWADGRRLYLLEDSQTD